MCRMSEAAHHLHPHHSSVVGASRSFPVLSPRTILTSSFIWSCSPLLELCVTVTAEESPHAPLIDPGLFIQYSAR